MSTFSDKIKEIDKFHYIPVLSFKGKQKQTTLLGGYLTMFIGLYIMYYLGEEMHRMLIFEGFYFRSFETVADMKEIGKIKLDEMGTLPFYGVHYKGHRLDRRSEDCQETGGDCFQLTTKYLKLRWNNRVEKWSNAVQTSTTREDNYFESHVCTATELGQELYDSGQLFICPPQNTILFQNRFDLFPSLTLGFEVKPKFTIENKKALDEVNNF